MNSPNKQLTSDEVEKILKKPLPDTEEELLGLREKVRQNMHGGHAHDQFYKQRLDFLRSVDFKLQWISWIITKDVYEMNNKMNRRMFYIALASSIIAFVSVLAHIFKLP